MQLLERIPYYNFFEKMPIDKFTDTLYEDAKRIKECVSGFIQENPTVGRIWQYFAESATQENLLAVGRIAAAIFLAFQTVLCVMSPFSLSIGYVIKSVGWWVAFHDAFIIFRNKSEAEELRSHRDEQLKEVVVEPRKSESLEKPKEAEKTEEQAQEKIKYVVPTDVRYDLHFLLKDTLLAQLLLFKLKPASPPKDEPPAPPAQKDGETVVPKDEKVISSGG